MAEYSVRSISYVINCLNILFFLLGICLLGIGAWGEATIGPYAQLSSVEYTTVPRVLMALGAAIVVVTVFGCCVVMRENKCMLTMFFMMLLVLLLLETTVTVLAFRNQYEIKKQLDEDIRKNVEDYPKENVKAVDDLQEELKCCGSSGPDDWLINFDYKRTNDTTSVPDSCCKQEFKGQDCGRGQRLNQTKIYTTGCYQALKQKILENLVPTGVLAFIVLILQFKWMCSALFLILRMD